MAPLIAIFGPNSGTFIAASWCRMTHLKFQAISVGEDLPQNH